VPSVAVTTIDEVPLVVMDVDMDNVSVLVSPDARVTEAGVKVGVAPDGRPEVTERLTVPPP
jgi:hypothetical protein